jgi:hypothetical protein
MLGISAIHRPSSSRSNSTMSSMTPFYTARNGLEHVVPGWARRYSGFEMPNPAPYCTPASLL